MPSFDQIHPFLISLVMSLIIGIERERSHAKEAQAAGVRTFMLFGLLGTLAAYINNNYFSIGVTFFVAAIVLIGYWKTTRSPTSDQGLTTEVSAVVVFALGYLTTSAPSLVLLLGVAVFAILFSRPWLHRFARDILKPQEIQSALTLTVLLVGVLPYLPNRTVDPWGFLNPQKLASVIFVLAGIQFASYVAVRMLGQRIGSMLAGFLGGLVSSTSVFVTLSRKIKKHPIWLNLGVASALLATLGMLLEFAIIVMMAAPELGQIIALPISAMCLAGFAIAYTLTSKERKHESGEIGGTRNPLDIKSVIELSTFIIGMLVLVAVTNRWLGSQALQAAVFLGSLFELHGVTFSTANLVTLGQINHDEAKINLGLAIGGAFLSKFLIVWTLNRGRFALLTSLALFAMLLVGFGTLLLISQTQ